jgi:hypothetical protein
MKNMPQSKLDKQEARIPALAAEAVRVAQEKALSLGHSVLIVEDGRLVRKAPDGKKKRVGWVGRRVRVERSEAEPIRWLVTFPE